MSFLSWINDNIINPTREFIGIKPVGYDNTLSGKIDETTRNIIQNKDIYENITKPTMDKIEPAVNAIGIKTPNQIDTSSMITGKTKTTNEILDDMTVDGSLGEKIMNIASIPNKITEQAKDNLNKATETPTETPTETDEKANADTTTPTIQEIWEREDKIRKETQAREDSAYQRAIEDMRKAGINPNLLGSISPAQSGGGITQATGTNLASTELNGIIQQTLNAINNEVKMSENQKDRTTDILRTLAMVLLLKK